MLGFGAHVTTGVLILIFLTGVLYSLNRRKGTILRSGHALASRRIADNNFPEKSGNITNIVEKTIFGTILLFFFLLGMGGILSSRAEADSSVTVKNETGYDLEEVKYVREVDAVKSLAGQARLLTNGASHTFRLKEGGAYRVYASFNMDGKKVYAKGNANNLRDGGQYRLTLKKVVVSQSGSSLNFINQSEFDAIR